MELFNGYKCTIHPKLSHNLGFFFIRIRVTKSTFFSFHFLAFFLGERTLYLYVYYYLLLYYALTFSSSWCCFVVSVVVVVVVVVA